MLRSHRHFLLSSSFPSTTRCLYLTRIYNKLRNYGRSSLRYVYGLPHLRDTTQVPHLPTPFLIWTRGCSPCSPFCIWSSLYSYDSPSRLMLPRSVYSDSLCMTHAYIHRGGPRRALGSFLTSHSCLLTQGSVVLSTLPPEDDLSASSCVTIERACSLTSSSAFSPSNIIL
jgi:hypothetical protein